MSPRFAATEYYICVHVLGIFWETTPLVVNDVIMKGFVCLLSTTFSPIKIVVGEKKKIQLTWKTSRRLRMKCLEIRLSLHFGSGELVLVEKGSHTVGRDHWVLWKPSHNLQRGFRADKENQWVEMHFMTVNLLRFWLLWLTYEASATFSYFENKHLMD